eukprot:5090115-Lingulodinium_polyedra.AAC.1
MNKAQNPEDLVYIIHALTCQAARGDLHQLIVMDTGGSQKDGNKGYVDLIFCERLVQREAMAKGKD